MGKEKEKGEIEINGKFVKIGQQVLVKATLIKESGTGGKGFNLEIDLLQGGALIKNDRLSNEQNHGKITLINISPDKIVINE